MPLPQGIANPGGAFGLPLSGTNIAGSVVMSNDGIYLEMVNNSGGTVQYGAVLDTDVTGLLATTAATVQDPTVIGVAAQVGSTSTNQAAYPAGGPILVQIRGVARVNIGSASTVVGTMLTASAVAGVAGAVAAAAPILAPAASAPWGVNLSGTFATALEANAAKDTNNTIRCKLCGGV